MTTDDIQPYQHAFKNGRIVTIKPVQRVALALIRTALDKKWPKPAAPVNHTDLGDIANTADPAYAEAVKDWDRIQGGRAQLHALRFSIVFDDALVAADLAQLDADQARLNAYFAEMGLPPATFGDIDNSDANLVAEMDDSRGYLKWLYWVACAGDAGEVLELIRAVADISDAEGAIQAAMPTFRG